MALKGIKVRLYPTKEQEVYISKLLGCCRLVYNELFDFYETYFLEKGKGATAKEAYKAFKELRNKYPFITEVHSKPVSNERIIAITAWVNFFKSTKEQRKRDGNLKFGKPTKHKRRKHDSCLFDRQAFRYIRGNRISLIKKLSNIHFKCSRDDEIYLNRHQKKIRSITLRRCCSGKYIGSILVEDIRERTIPPTKGCIGIDVGVVTNITTSDKEKIENPRILEKYEKRIKFLERKLSNCDFASKRYSKRRLALAKAHEKIANIRNNHQHQITTKLTNEHSGIFIEHLDVHHMLRTSTNAKEIGDAAMASLLNMLEYKSLRRGRMFAKVDMFFPSSKRCHNCGYIYHNLQGDEREWICKKCGMHHDRDYNAALNILEEGLRLVGLGSPEPKNNARGQVYIGISEEKSLEKEVPWENRESKCSSRVSSLATEP